jgi:hypothetical protein
MSDQRLERREEQARREVGWTEIARVSSVVLIAAFIATMGAGLVGRIPGIGAEATGAEPFGIFARQARSVFSVGFDGNLRARNRALHRAVDDLEAAVEERSWMRQAIRPGVQALLSGGLGVGNEQVYLGSGGWLYFRPSVDYLTGPTFLDPSVLERRSQGGEAWSPAPHPDPLPAVEGWARDLSERGIQLMLMPIPVKPSLRPQGMIGETSEESGPINNPGYEEFLRRVQALGVEIYDPTADLLALAEEGSPVYLRADTHWRPEAVERVARGLAAAIRGWAGGEGVDLGTAPGGYRRQLVSVTNRGDLFDLLGVPATQDLIAAEEVELGRVVDSGRRLWRVDPAAPILLLGDSFSNVYSMPELGWGEGAGLAEQLSLQVGAPIDKLAANAGGAHGARERLLAALAAGDDRLAGKRLVIWQFAQRELAVGDWKPLPLP